MVDIGGESTRPGAAPVSAEEELARVVPVLEGLGGLPLSIDTAKAAVARRALELGAPSSSTTSPPCAATRTWPRWSLTGTRSSAHAHAGRAANDAGRSALRRRRLRRVAPSSRSASRSPSSRESARSGSASIRGSASARRPTRISSSCGGWTSSGSLGRPVLIGVSRKSTLGKILGDTECDHGDDGRLARGDCGRVRARRVDDPRARRARDRRGARRRRRGRAWKDHGVTIELSSLVVFGHHGYLEEERRLGQRFLVDLWVDVHGDAAESDRIDDTVDYRRLAALVREVFAGRGAAPARGACGRRGGRDRRALCSRRERPRPRPQARRRARAAGRLRRGARRAHARVTLARTSGSARTSATARTTLRRAVELLERRTASR